MHFSVNSRDKVILEYCSYHSTDEKEVIMQLQGYHKSIFFFTQTRFSTQFWGEATEHVKNLVWG